MKYIFLITLAVFFLVNALIAELAFSPWLWLSSPILVAFLIEIAYIKGLNVSRVIPKTMIVVFPLGILAYLAECCSTSTDAQAGLIVALIPLYQFFAITVILFVGLLLKGFARVAKPST